MRSAIWLGVVVTLISVALIAGLRSLGLDTVLGVNNYPPAGTDEFDSLLTVDDVVLDLDFDGAPETSTGGTQLNGPVKVDRGAPGDGDGDGLDDIETEIVSMELTGGGLTIRAGSDFGITPSTGLIEQQVPGVDFPADSFFDVFIELTGTPFGPLENCGGQPVRVEQKINAIPPLAHWYLHPGTVIELCDVGGANRVNLVRVAHIPLVGGIAGFPGEGDGLLPEAADSSDGPSTALYAALAGAAAAITLIAGGWYARRRWLS